MAWTGQNFSVGQILTAAQMTNLQADISAQANGDSGAPKTQTAALEQTGGSEAVTTATIRANAITQTEVNTAAIGQDELNDATQNYSVSVSAASLTLQAGAVSTGGPFVMGYSVQHTGTGTIDIIGMMGRKATATSYENYITMMASSDSGARTCDILALYIAASPPYSFGAGDIPLFVFAQVENGTGRIISTSASVDPPWMNNGKTRVHAEVRNKAGQSFMYVPKTPFTSYEQVASNPVLRRRYTQAMADFREDRIANGELIEITKQFKNSDMDEVPHAFMGVEEPNATTVLLDPLSPVVLELYDMRRNGETISYLLHDGDIKIGNTHTPMNGPQGLKIVSADWKTM